MKKIALISLIFLIPLLLNAQLSEDEIKIYYLDAEFFFATEEYLDALYDYMELYKNGYEDNANINYRIGACYTNIPGQQHKAIPHLLKAIEYVDKDYKGNSIKEKTASVDAYLYLGNAYRVTNQLDKAISAYNKYKQLVEKSDPSSLEYAINQIQACKVAKMFMANPLNISKKNIGEPINTSSGDFNAVISGDGSTIVYMHELPFYNAIYFSTFANGAWSEPLNITPQIQSDGDQYVSDLSYDGKTLLLTKFDNFNSDIYISSYENGRWAKSQQLSKEINTKFWESHASFNKEGDVIYFTSNKKGGYGEVDIYVTTKQVIEGWGTPENLGSTINSKLNEESPFVTEDGKTLYFSSQGHLNMGGYDIFKSVKDEYGSWSEPENLGFPINTTGDDIFYVPFNNGDYGYKAIFTTKEGYGKEDIFKLKILTAEEAELTIAETIQTEAEEEKEIQQTAMADLPEEEMEEVTDEAIEEEGVEEERVSEITKEKVEEPVSKASIEIFINPILFTFDKYTINENGKAELDKIAKFMTEYPAVTTQLIGHSDNVGPEDYNQRLSEQRAVTALKYLTRKGINAERLKAQGMGEKQPLAPNTNQDETDNPEGRRLNRRVDFDIEGVDSAVITIRYTYELPQNK